MKLIDLRGKSTREAAEASLPRPAVDATAAVETVEPILLDVEKRGAKSLYHYAEQFDSVRPPALRVPAEALKAALAELDPKVREALEIAADNVRRAHAVQIPEPAITKIVPGGTITQRWVPLSRVGLYVPGGLAVYPSSVVMNVVTAQVAGVPSFVVASPPQKEFGGLPHPTILAACELLGVDEVIAVGGAQAVGAMAYGFEDGGYVCEPVDKVAGPGNIYVAAAKRVVQDVCGIDAEAGTTEIAILADAGANAAFVAADLIGQAEHDPAAASVLVTDSETLAGEVIVEIERQVAKTPHADRVRTALAGPQSAIVLVDDLDVGEAIIERYAPEHLEIMTVDAPVRGGRIRHAGAIFVGDYSPVALGDYLAGSNHVLPTGGTARFAAGLNATQYLRSVQVVNFDDAALSRLGEPVKTLATAEGLPAHAESVQLRFEKEGKVNGVKPRLPNRGDLADVRPYGAPQLDVPVRLNVNENPYPPSTEVINSVTEAVREALAELNRYADRDATKLREKLGEYLRVESGVEVDVSQVWAANGSNEVMLQLLEAFGGPGRVALAGSPTYSMYEEYARDTSTKWVLLPPAEGNSPFPEVDIEGLKLGMQKHRPSVVFLPNPNNPTGQMLSEAQIESILETALETGPILEGLPTCSLVVLDEAYAEFRGEHVPSALRLLEKYPNLLVTRTMSKAFAAAGLRLGYLVSSPEIVHEINKVRLPYHLSLLTQAAARAVLSHTDAQLAQVAKIRADREDLEAWLTGRGFQVAPSEANFLLFGPLPDREAVWQALVDRGVLVRVVGPSGFLRVTIGTEEENEKFKQALEEALQ